MSDEMKDLTPFYCPVCRAPLGELGKGSRVGLTCHKCGKRFKINCRDGVTELQLFVPSKQCSAETA